MRTCEHGCNGCEECTDYDDVPNESKVLGLAQQRHKRLTLAAFDAMSHADRRKRLNKRAEIERAARDNL